MRGGTYDRSAQDVGNIVFLEHVNVRVPDQVTATSFYISGLGLTRDPYIMVGTDNMWANAGQSQFHLPTGSPNVIPGYVDLVVPDLGALRERLEAVKKKLAETKFAFSTEDKHVLVTCPWGNRFRCYAPAPEFGDVTLGIGRVEVPVRPGAAQGIARFYQTVMGAPSVVTGNGEGNIARVRIGQLRQELVFRETAGDIRPFDGHHIAVYIADFSGPHARLKERGLVSEESSDIQYRFQEIVDPDTKEPLATLEHEVRCLTHPMYFRPLVNRNPAQRQPTYQRGRDPFIPGMV
jgi:hypothetical protein